MGNYKFRLADMMPNAWFYKLRDMSKKKTKPKINQKNVQDQKIIINSSTKKKTKKTKKKKKNTNCSSSSPSSPSTTVSSKPNLSNQFPICHRSPRKSYYFTRELVGSNSPPRKNFSASESPRRLSAAKKRRSVSKPPQKKVQTVREHEHDSVWISPPEYSSSSSRSDGNLAGNSVPEKIGEDDDDDDDDVDSLSRLTLPPIATKAKKKGIIVNDTARKSSAGISTVTNAGSPGIRLRINNSPRIADRRVSGLSRKSVSSSSEKKKKIMKEKTSFSESFAVVKSSFDPQRDFRESMIEMIVENNIRSSKELEDLLACYLSLNSDEYHGLIIKVFKQIWFDITNISN